MRREIFENDIVLEKFNVLIWETSESVYKYYKEVQNIDDKKVKEYIIDQCEFNKSPINM